MAMETILKDFNDLYKKIIRISDPEDYTVREIRGMILRIIGYIEELREQQVIPMKIRDKFMSANKNGAFTHLVWKVSMGGDIPWSEVDVDPLPLWRSFQDSLIVFVREATRYLTPAPEKFSWRKLTIYNPSHINEGVLKKALDALEEGMELLKRRGLEDALYASLKGVYFTAEGYKFTGSSSGQNYTSAGHYTPNNQTITMVISQVDADKNARLIKRWFTEIFLHEFGHHIHLSYITRAAKEFWDSGWDLIVKAREEISRQNTISLDDMIGFVRLLDAARWDYPGVGRKLKGLDRAKYLLWLNQAFLTTTPNQVRVTKNGEMLGQYFRDHRQGFMFDNTDQLRACLDNLRDLGYPLLRSLPDYVRDYLQEGGGQLDHMYQIEISKVLMEETQEFFMSQRVALFSNPNRQIPSEILAKQALEDSSVRKALQDAIEALGIPSDYGKENFKEDFAETFVLFVAAPDRLSPVARWRMGRTLGISEAGGKKTLRLSQKIAMIYSMEVL